MGGACDGFVDDVECGVLVIWFGHGHLGYDRHDGRGHDALEFGRRYHRHDAHGFGTWYHRLHDLGFDELVGFDDLDWLDGLDGLVDAPSTTRP